MSGALARIARYGLPATVGTGAEPSGVTERIASRPLDRAAWEELAAEVQRLRLTGFLAAAVERDALPVTRQQGAEVAARHLEACASALQLERVLLRAAALLDGAGLEFLVLKGTAHAHLLYPDPAWRMFGDNDLLVRAADLGEVVELFRSRGYVRRVPQALPGFDARFGKGVTLRHPGGDELDLHRTLLFGTFGLLVDPDRLFASATTFELGGRRLGALGEDTRLLHACYHAALGDPVPRLGALRDVAQALAGPHDPEAVLGMADDWAALPVLARALELCRTHLEIEVAGPIAAAASRHEATRRERRAIASYVGSRRSFAAKVLASLPYVDGSAQKLALVRAATFPDRALRRSVGPEGPMSWLRKGVRGLRRRDTDELN